VHEVPYGDYRYSVLIFVFAGLIREGWMSMDDLAELGDDKRKKIDMLLRIADQ
jgi:hypothetical protein